MRDHSNDFFFTCVQGVEAGLSACGCCAAGEGVGTGFGGPKGVDCAVVDVWEEGFHVCEGAACVAGFVGVFCEGWRLAMGVFMAL
jgi:hypothetical protein